MNYLSTTLLLILLFTSKVYSQLPTQKNGLHKDMALGSYFESYKSLNTDSFNSIKKVLYTTLNYKNIDAVLENEMEDVKMFSKGWCVLMRMADIDWKDKKYEVIDMLHDFSQQIMSGKSYLTINDLDRYQNEEVSKTHPAFFPFYAYWVMLKIDTDYSLKYVNEMIDSDNAVLGSSSYQKQFKTTLFGFLQKHYKSDEVVRFCAKNSIKCGIQDANLVIELKKKNEVYHLKDQGLVWDYFIANYSIKPIDTESGWSWYWHLIFFNELYQEPDVNVLFSKVKSSKNYEDTYYLLYSLCFFINGKLSNPEQLPTAAVKIEAANAINIVDKYYAEYGTKLKFNNESNDLLKSCSTSIKYNLANKN